MGKRHALRGVGIGTQEAVAGHITVGELRPLAVKLVAGVSSYSAPKLASLKLVLPH